MDRSYLTRLSDYGDARAALEARLSDDEMDAQREALLDIGDPIPDVPNDPVPLHPDDPQPDEVPA